jgi:rod shape-determining protein MreD
MNSQATQAPVSFTVVGSIVTILLQLMLASSIAVFDVVPNFMLCFAVINAMFSREIRATATGFLLGLMYDFIASGALGSMALVLTLLAYGVSLLNKEAISISWTIQAFFLLVSAFVGELLYAAELSIIGYDNNFLMSLGMRVIPNTIYSALIGLIAFLIMSRFSKRNQPPSLRGKLK